ncbi:hypothetical protein G3U99_23390 [Vibrio coralliilyticus OCN008]|uniref:hypothetical protein n=1 Tax=Vibrio coralliilyticus TaxID=190893 RepID=UPI0013F481CD|nr:hypothetical protein [Vibrio coralliilyticus]QIJ87178.1 hypothetical protein G3U99_23390 [Vibrio coralliilyticus OCN008]
MSEFDKFNNARKAFYESRTNSCKGSHRWKKHPNPSYDGQQICCDCPMTGKKCGNGVIPDSKI